jgi:F-type H+-transporting ATPase subunit delta
MRSNSSPVRLDAEPVAMTEKLKHETAFDSARQQLGDTYAKALVAALEKSGTTDDAMAELNSLIEDVWNRHETLETVMNSPRITFSEKERILDSAFQGKMDPLLLNFLKVVAQHSRMDCLRTVRHSANSLVNDLRGRKEVVVETAIKLDDNLRQTVTEHLTGILNAEVILEERVNPELLGGIRVRVGDTVFDGTVANRLQSLQQLVGEQTSRKVRDKPLRFATN